MTDADREPPRNGEGDRPAQPGGGGVFDTTRKIIKLARKERRSGNLPEVMLWRALKQRPGGLKFRRQHPIGRYILDFACLSARVAIEVDGIVHDNRDRAERDRSRDAWLGRQGFTVLRIPAAQILEDCDAVSESIVAACLRATPLHQPAAGPPPHAGEVLRKSP